MPPVAYTAARGILDGVEIANAYVEVDDAGMIVRTASGRPPGAPVVHDLGDVLLVPGLVNAHSHAFQRGIRGRTHRRDDGDPSDFWSWRQAMYAEANRLGPDSLYEATRRAYREMLGAGITCVGEFHYVHHQPDGTPYSDPNELSNQIVRAAADVGIRLVLLEVLYERAGPGEPPLPEQARFCDANVDAYLARVDALRAAGVNVGLAPHSIRAVTSTSLSALAAYATEHDLQVHAHVSEQPRENEICAAEHDATPTEVFERTGCTARPHSFTAVHAIHITDGDRARLGAQHVCACPTTEADLGDGIVGAAELAAAGTTLALGSDSNAVVDLVQEARLLEMGERLRQQARLRLVRKGRGLGATLLEVATSGGASSLGVGNRLGVLAAGRPFDACVVDLRHASLENVPGDSVLDAWMLAGTAAPVLATFVAGRRESSR